MLGGRELPGGWRMEPLKSRVGGRLLCRGQKRILLLEGVSRASTEQRVSPETGPQKEG